MAVRSQVDCAQRLKTGSTAEIVEVRTVFTLPIGRKVDNHSRAIEGVGLGIADRIAEGHGHGY